MNPIALPSAGRPPSSHPARPGVSDLPIFRQDFAATAGGTDTIAPQVGFVLRVVGFRVIGGDNATTCKLTSTTTGADVSETLYLGEKGGGIQIEKDREGIMLDAPLNEGITITAGAGNAIAGFVSYLKIPQSRFSLANDGSIIGWNDGSPYIG